jgi:restriction system protein
MAIPGYQDFMLPLLKLAADGSEHTVPEAMAALAKELAISAEDQELLLPSGTQTRFYNRVSWAVTYLAKSLLLEKASRGKFRISQRGREVLAGGPIRIDNAFLQQFEEYKNFKTSRRVDSAPDALPDPTESAVQLTPAEQLNDAYEDIRDTLADDLLQRVRAATPKDFERLVVQLLVALGYGGGQIEHAEVTGKSGDDGIDGVIREDRLGLDMVYVQAKKWEYTVGPGEIDKFVGSLMRKKATKGVFITSGKFTDGAERAAREAAVKVRLIDGIELAKLMFDFDVGVSPVRTYVLKRIDTDFFEELSLG